MRRKHPIDYGRAKVRREILIRQRREIWTPEQVASFAKHFRLRPGMKLLDAGCGFGYVMRTYGPYCLPGGELVGVDRDKKLLATAARFCRKEGLAKTARFECSDIYKMPFRDNTFDISIAHVVLCHLAEPQRVLDELIRVTRRGGCVAVFDNATSGGGFSWWCSWHEPTVGELTRDLEFGVRMKNGRAKLGFGDFGVGLHMPSWMEARGLRDVDARTNERVYWLAPPYSSANQQTTYRNLKERLKERPRWDRVNKTELDQMQAGGLSRAEFDAHRRESRAVQRALRKALRDGTAASAGSGAFWCIWGFKPMRSHTNSSRGRKGAGV
jgi:SAM-dependent methyltransferase